jgi:ABC-2 type transport system ATP-binding protein
VVPIERTSPKARTAVTAPPAISAVELVKKYGEVTALDGLSFTIPAGTVFGLLGPNGAGKSTTIKILTTLSRPTSGTATVAGIDVLRRPDAVRRAIGVVTQRASTEPVATGRESLVLAGRIHGMRGAAAKARADELLERFGLTEAANRLVRTYSGGMERKLDVALGLMHRPRVLFLDEPTTGLDPQARAEMWAEIARLAGEEQLTILLTTHYLDEAQALADRVAIIKEGRIVAEGPPAELAPGKPRYRVSYSLNGHRSEHETDDPTELLHRLTGDALRRGERLENLSVSRPTLEDVYLELTAEERDEA